MPTEIAVAPQGHALERNELTPEVQQPASPFVVGPPARLFTALAIAQSEFTPVAKTKTAKIRPREGGAEFTYKYADLADILMMALPILARNGIAVTQPIRRDERGQMLVVTELHHSSGETLTDDGLPLVSGGSPQAFGSLLTYMRRYGFTSLVGIQADADEDGQLAANEKAEQSALAAARRRTPASGGASASSTPSGEAGTAKPGPEETWSAEQVAAFDAARKKAGWKKDPTLAYVRDVLGVPNGNPKGALAAQYEAAMAWAEAGPSDPPKAGAASTPARTSTAQAAPAADGTKPATIDHAQKTAFWDTARKHGKGDKAIGRYLEQVLGITSTADMPLSRYAEALKWAATNEDAGPAQSEEERKARQAFGILGLDFAQQSEVIDHHKGNWAAIAEACDAEITRRDEAQP